MLLGLRHVQRGRQPILHLHVKREELAVCMGGQRHIYRVRPAQTMVCRKACRTLPQTPVHLSHFESWKCDVQFSHLFPVHRWQSMETGPVNPTEEGEIRNDLKAAVRARRELDPDMEDHLLEGFLARIDQRVQAQVAQQVSTARPVQRASKYNPTEIVATTFGVAIPLMVIAAIFAHTAGVFAVVGLVLAVNLLYYLDNRF
jgi:hypothetical protein